MSEVKKLNEQALDNVVGGVTRTIHNDAVSYANIRDDIGLNAKVLTTMKNGTKVELTGNEPIKKDGYVWYEIWINPGQRGWIAGSLIGY